MTFEGRQGLFDFALVEALTAKAGGQGRFPRANRHLQAQPDQGQTSEEREGHIYSRDQAGEGEQQNHQTKSLIASFFDEGAQRQACFRIEPGMKLFKKGTVAHPVKCS